MDFRWIYVNVMRKNTDERRRRLLKLLGTGAAFGAVASTGCLDDGTEEQPEDDDEEPDEGPEDQPDDEPEEVAVDEPSEFPEDANCPVCNMVPAEHPDWNAQVVHDDGERAYFCSVGCMTAYVGFADRFFVSDAELAGAWVSEYGTDKLIDGLDAHYALETDPDRVDDNMMLNPAAFEDRDDAVEYVEAVDYLDEDDIVGFDDLGADTGRDYRGQQIDGAEA